VSGPARPRPDAEKGATSGPSGPTAPGKPGIGGLRRDPARLAALRATGLLDTDPEPAFDRLTRLAVALLGVPAAFLSLVDEHRDFYKAATGLGEPLATARQLTGATLCHHALAGSAPLVIPDTAAHPVYRHVTSVQALGVAAYVGVPLVVGGQTIGSFCAIDTAPHAWTAAEVDVLVELSGSALREIALRQANALLEARAHELELVNQQLQDQAAELELQTEELQAATEQLIERTEAAERAERQLEAAFAQAPAAVAVTTGPEHRFVLANARYTALVGRPVAPGRTFDEVLPEVAAQGYTALLDRVYATGAPHVSHEALALVDRGGAALEEGWYDFVYQPLTDGEGRVTGVMQLGIDVTEPVRARRVIEETDAALVASESRYRTLTEAVPVQVWTAQPDGQLAFVSERTTAFFGVPAERVLGTGWGAFVHPDDLPAALARWRASLATGAPYQAEFRLRAAATGEYRWHLSRALSERDASGAVTGWVGTNTDVDDERRALAEAQAARRAAEQANQAKAEFLATMSHELRTPLNAIGGYAELMEMGIRGPVTEEQRQDLGRIQQSQRHLLGLVNEVLDLAKVDAGALRVESAAVRAGDTVDAALALVRPQAAARRLVLSDACGGAADLPYLGDEPRVRQVLANLLSNAVKFTEPGGRVTVACAVTDAPPASSALVPAVPYVAFRIEDTGGGIPADQRERIFEPFTQVESGPSPYALPMSERRGSAREATGAPAGDGAALAGRAASAPDVTAGLARIGGALAADAGSVIRAWVARLRAEPTVPVADRTDAELEDHVATFVTDVGLGLRAFAAQGAEPAALRLDGGGGAARAGRARRRAARRRGPPGRPRGPRRGGARAGRRRAVPRAGRARERGRLSGGRALRRDLVRAGARRRYCTTPRRKRASAEST
jgi:PAS domain S-box-containing protein